MYSKTGKKKKHATCLATLLRLLQNELDSDVVRLTDTHIKSVSQQIRLLTGLIEGGIMRNIAFKLVWQQYYITTSCTFLLSVLSKLNGSQQ